MTSISELAELAKIRECLIQVQNVLPRNATREEKDDLRNALFQIEKSFKEGVVKWSFSSKIVEEKSKLSDSVNVEQKPLPVKPGRPKKVPDAVKRAMEETEVKQVEVR